MIYVGSPYSHPNPRVVEDRVARVTEFVDRLVTLRFVAFSPIVYCHPIAQRIKAPTHAHHWHAFNMSMLRKAEAMYVLELEGHDVSEGLKMECQIARILDMVIVRYDENFKLLSLNFHEGLVAQL